MTSEQIAFHVGAVHPKYFRLPARGRDSVFGFSRSFYYQGEERGYWKLVRLIEDGRQRGVTLVPYDAVERFIAERERTMNPHSGNQSVAKKEN